MLVIFSLNYLYKIHQDRSTKPIQIATVWQADTYDIIVLYLFKEHLKIPLPNPR